jgi:DNA-binding NarL/FixJ family response regulator
MEGIFMMSPMETVVAAKTIRVVVAVGQTIFRQGLRMLLEREPEITVVGEAKTSEELLDLVAETKPDVLLLDVQLSGNPQLESLRQLKNMTDAESVRTILLLPSIQQSEVVRAMKLGACGVVAKDAPPEILLKSIRAVMNGILWVDREIIQSLINVNRGRKPASETRVSDLTPRELDIVRAIVEGRVNKEIAETFNISEYTVKHHLTRIFDKLRVANRVELAIFALTHGLVNDSQNTQKVLGKPA